MPSSTVPAENEAGPIIKGKPNGHTLHAEPPQTAGPTTARNVSNVIFMVIKWDQNCLQKSEPDPLIWAFMANYLLFFFRLATVLIS